ncbi:MAG: PKD domain-containing protein [Bacteroidia bacterium]|nr:PKD domain-containing protein [Bacteroidia bacterium]
MNDEFSPVFHNGDIVFCSNISDNSLVSYNDGHERLFNLFSVSGKNNPEWKQPVLFSKELRSGYNDGPATFGRGGDLIFFSRNNRIDKKQRNISDTTNLLGIYSAEFRDGIWTDVKSFQYNNPLYTFGTPSLTPDGRRIYFSSDMPGGYGGMDLYYCDSVKSGWAEPVNLGPSINTSRNESFPFADENGKLYFSSDGHNGMGGKDIYYSFEVGGIWLQPVHLDSPINSDADDFGIVTDSTFSGGFFSTNRLSTDDIFSFNLLPAQFESCDTLKVNRYCFTLYDERNFSDTIPVIYVWNFGNGIIKKGKEVNHCFPGPGKYTVLLSIYDEMTGDTITADVSYNVDLEEIAQSSIQSVNVGIADNSISFNGIISAMKDFRVTDFYWDFGDGFSPGGPVMNHVFPRRGEYNVRLGLTGEMDSLGNMPKSCVMKKIMIYRTFQEYDLTTAEMLHPKDVHADSSVNRSEVLETFIYLMDDLSERQKTKIRTSLKEIKSPVLKSDRSEIDLSSFNLLQIVEAILKENRDIRVEIAVYSLGNEVAGNKMELSERYAQEIAFWFRNCGAGSGLSGCKGYGLTRSVFKPDLPGSQAKRNGFIEFIFMKN